MLTKHKTTFYKFFFLTHQAFSLTKIKKLNWSSTDRSALHSKVSTSLSGRRDNNIQPLNYIMISSSSVLFHDILHDRVYIVYNVMQYCMLKISS